MCGIAGFYTPKAERTASENMNIARKIEQSIAHRGPDRGDVWQDEGGLNLIHRRLAIIDLSDDGAQPMMSPSERYVISFNGEIYNYLELRRDLLAQNVQFKGASDTEILLGGFDLWGVEKTLSKINGMFAFALYDRQKKYIHFVRDRFGKKPLYVGWVDGALVFASELKAFHCYPNFQAEINPDVLALYMKYGYVHAPYSIFKNVWQLLPASFLSLNLSKLDVNENLATKMKICWSLKNIVEEGRSNPVKKSDALIVDEFEQKLMKAVSMRMVSDVPLGAFLSGGIDSSAIVALMNKKSEAAVKTFSVGFEQKGFDEAQYAKKIACHIGADHHEFYCNDQDALNIIPQLPMIYDEPFADVSQIPTYLISAKARGHVTVVLTGDGGDEILGGYDRHTKLPNIWKKIGWIPKDIRQFLCYSLNILPEEFYKVFKPNNLKFGAQVKRAIGLMGLKNPDLIYDMLVSSSIDGDKTVLNATLPLIPLHDKTYWPENLDFLNKMLFGDMLSYRSNDLMVKTDRATMAVGLEARAPFMDYELAEYSWRLPQHMKVQGGKGKWVLREVLKRYVPQELYERPKMGFSVPIEEWLKGSLNGWANDLLNENRLKQQGLLDSQLITQKWQNFQKNEGLKTSHKDLWSHLMFQAWHDTWKK